MTYQWVGNSLTSSIGQRTLKHEDMLDRAWRNIGWLWYFEYQFQGQFWPMFQSKLFELYSGSCSNDGCDVQHWPMAVIHLNGEWSADVGWVEIVFRWLMDQGSMLIVKPWLCLSMNPLTEAQHLFHDQVDRPTHCLIAYILYLARNL